MFVFVLQGREYRNSNYWSVPDLHQLNCRSVIVLARTMVDWQGMMVWYIW